MPRNNELDLEYLLKTAQEGPDKKVHKNSLKGDVELFIAALDLLPSDKPIPFIDVYRAYKEWSKKPVDRDRFSKVISKTFKRKKILGERCLLIMPDAIGLPSDYSFYTDDRYIKLKREPKDQDTRYIGTYRLPNGKYYSKLILPTGRRISLGTFLDIRLAALSYDKAALQVYGREALVNFPRIWKDILDGTKAWPIKKKDFTQKSKEAFKEAIWQIFTKEIKEQECHGQQDQDEGRESKDPSSS